MRIDRYVHDERLTWGAAGVLTIVTLLHATGIGRLLTLEPQQKDAQSVPVFQVSLIKLPPPKLPELTPPRVQDAPTPPSDDSVKTRPRKTRPVPVLVDTPTERPVPPDTQVKQYEIGDELLEGEPGPPLPEGAEEGEGPYADAVPVEQTPVIWNLKLIDMKPPVYPPRCLRMGIEGVVRVRVLVGEHGEPQEVTLGKSSGESALDRAAMDAVRGWRFEPARRNGVPVRAWAIVPVEFKLMD